MNKFQLYSSLSAWNAKHEAIKTYLGIPSGETLEYAVPFQINNPAHPDFEKYPFLVVEEGWWKCDQEFAPEDLVDYDPTWLLPTVVEE